MQSEISINKNIETYNSEPINIATTQTKFIRRLITNEDPYHVHKVLGMYCLLNFAAQSIIYAYS